MLFIIGGRNNTSSGNIDTASVDRYDPLRDEWRPVKPLSVPRNRLGVATIDGFIYAIGGGNGNTCHTSVERYDLQQDEWTTVMPLNFPRIGKYYLVNQCTIGIACYLTLNYLKLPTVSNFNKSFSLGYSFSVIYYIGFLEPPPLF